MTVVDLALYRSLEGELTPTICSARALLTVWLYVKEQAQTVLAFLFHCVPSLVDHRQTMESCSLNRLPLRFHIPDSRGSRVAFVLFSCCSLGHEGQGCGQMADCSVWKKQKEFFPSQFLLLFSSVLVLVVEIYVGCPNSLQLLDLFTERSHFTVGFTPTPA